MSGARTIDDLIREKRLTPEEEELFHDIIEECRVREGRIREASDAARENIQSLATALSVIVDSFVTVNESVNRLHDEVSQLQLRMMPEDQFYRD